MQDVYPRISTALEGLEIGILGMYAQSYSDISQSPVVFVVWPYLVVIQYCIYLIIIHLFFVLFQLTMSVSCMTTHSIFFMFLTR